MIAQKFNYKQNIRFWIATTTEKKKYEIKKNCRILI